MPRLAWRPLLIWTLLGCAIAVALVLGSLAQTQDQLGALVDTSNTDVSAGVIGAELGSTALRPGGEHDGHYFYLIARAPMRAEASVLYLDRPGYRLGRPHARAEHLTGTDPGHGRRRDHARHPEGRRDRPQDRCRAASAARGGDAGRVLT